MSASDEESLMKRMTVLLGIALVSLGCSNDEGETSPASDASSATEIGQASDTIAAQD
ncbi:MAG: PBP1b-binding outer membrane lipoprotein LpoB, partial [Myxococcota bacterium]